MAEQFIISILTGLSFFADKVSGCGRMLEELIFTIAVMAIVSIIPAATYSKNPEKNMLFRAGISAQRMW